MDFDFQPREINKFLMTGLDFWLGLSFIP